MPQANSTISMRAGSEPIASLSTLPCSAVTSAASSVACSSRSCFSRNITLARRAGGVAAQAGKASAAAVTAASTSAWLAKATCFVTWPVAGS